MRISVTHFSRLGALAFICAAIGIPACSSTDEGTSIGTGTGRGGSNAGGTTGTGGAGGATGGSGGSGTTGGKGGTGGATGGTGGATGGTGGATGGTGGATGGTGGATGGTGGATGGTGGATGGTGGATGGAAGTTGGGSGTGGTAGKGGTAGASGSGGTAGSSGTGGAAGGKAGAAGTGGTGGGVDAGTPKDGGGTTDASGARFSFFLVSQAAMVALSGNAKGFGGDFRFGEADGLTGADKICTQTAERSMAGNGKTWRAFLSVTKGPSGTAVNAADRIGDGPWYDRIGRLIAANKTDLLQVRPRGADPAIINDLPNEDGVPNQYPTGSTTAHDNHATVTGSTAQGTLHSSGLAATCQDWTSAAADGGRPQVGLSFPRGTMASNWISVQTEPGCLPGGTIIQTGGAPPGDYSIGASGGYGGFYCFALTP